MAASGRRHGSGRDLHRRDALGTVGNVPPTQSGDPGDEDDVDDFDGDDFRPPLPPADRIWRHPSEVAAGSRAEAGRTGGGAPPTSSGSAAWNLRSSQAMAALTVAAILGATLSLGTVAAVGGFDTRTRVVTERVAAPPAVRSVADDRVGDIAEQNAPSIVAVRADHDGTTVAGSATVLRSDGYLLTNATLVRGASIIEIRTHDGGSHPATLVGADTLTDIAVVKVDLSDLRPAVLGSSSELAVGDRAIAIGAPDDGGWSTTITTGVVSATGRRLKAGDGAVLHGMLLFDAPMAPGVAGGPLLDVDGNVVGVTSGVPADGDGIRFGVATPIDTAKHVADQLMEYGHVKHVWLGIEGTDLASSTAMAMGIAGGATVTSVAENGPAAQAGVQPDDVIVGVDGIGIDSMSDLIGALRTRQPGEDLAITIRRGEVEHSVTVVLAERHDD